MIWKESTTICNHSWRLITVNCFSCFGNICLEVQRLKIQSADLWQSEKESSSSFGTLCFKPLCCFTSNLLRLHLSLFDRTFLTGRMFFHSRHCCTFISVLVLLLFISTLEWHNFPLETLGIWFWIFWTK